MTERQSDRPARPSRLPWVGVACVVLALAAIGAIAWGAGLDPDPTGSTATVTPMGADYVVMDAASATKSFNYVDIYAPPNTTFSNVSGSSGTCAVDMPASHIKCTGASVAPGAKMTVHGDATGLAPGAPHQVCVANTIQGGGGCVSVPATQGSATTPPPTGTTPTPTGTTPTETGTTPTTPPTETTTMPTPQTNSGPVCGMNEHRLAAKWLANRNSRRQGANSAAATGGPSPLQGQCTLPPRGKCLGTPGRIIEGGPLPDTLIGTPDSDRMNGNGANDGVDGKGDNDLLRGGPGRDTLNGGPCDDVLFSSGSDTDATWDGGPGNDVLNGKAVTMSGGPDDDYIVNGFPRRATTDGGGGNDTIVVTGEDGTVKGGAGNDVIDARNRSSDNIDCGPGSDTLFADPSDKFKNCEQVKMK